MARYQDLPVFSDIYALTARMFELTSQFPREYKFTLGQDMKRDCLVLLRSIYRINRAHDKAAHFDAFLDDFELLRMEIRLATGLGILPVRRQAELAVTMLKSERGTA